MPHDVPSGLAQLDAPPRVIIGCFALDQHEAGALVAATMLRDAGAEVIYLGRFNLPSHFATTAVQEDADVVGISCHSWEYRGYTSELLEEMAAAGADSVVVLGGSILTADDEKELLASGVGAVFGPSADRDAIVRGIWQLTADRRARRKAD